MKISIDRGVLLKALNHVQSVVERRNTIPILSNVKIDADEKGISLIATDLDLEIIEKVEAGKVVRIKPKRKIQSNQHLPHHYMIPLLLLIIPLLMLLILKRPKLQITQIIWRENKLLMDAHVNHRKDDNEENDYLLHVFECF